MQKYNGYNIKTKLELEYAKRLTKAKVKWQYKPKTFKLPNGTYTPTFYVPEMDTWVVIVNRWTKPTEKLFKLFVTKYSSMRVGSYTKKELEGIVEW